MLGDLLMERLAARNFPFEIPDASESDPTIWIPID
jgi:hypothetical protein